MGEEGRLHLYAATPQGQHGHLSSTSEPHSSTGPWCRKGWGPLPQPMPYSASLPQGLA